MTINELLQFEKHSHATVSQIRQSGGSFYPLLKRLAVDQLQRSVARAFDNSSKELRASIQGMDFGFDRDNKTPLKNRIHRSIKSSRLRPKLMREAESVIEKLALPETIDGVLHPDIPLSAHPLFKSEVERAKVYQLSAVASLSGPERDAVVRTAGSIVDLNDHALTKLIDNRQLTAKKAAELGFVANLYQLFDGRLELVRGVLSSPIRGLRGLITLATSGWEKLINAAKVKPPQGLASAEYAALLKRKVERLYPSEAVLQRLPASAVDGPFKTFLAQNARPDLLYLDYRADSPDIRGLKFDGLTLVEQKTALKTLKACQRVYSLAKDADLTAQLLEKGYDSAARIAKDSLPAFLNRSGVNAQDGERIYRNARNVLTHSGNALGTIAGVLTDDFGRMNVGNTRASVQEYLRRIDGFQALFGNLDYCHCLHCRSILGPAAYFVDLMRFVEKHILDVTFVIPGKEGHVLYLKNRRPDLWDLELTCDNTTTLIPYLVIINEILENYIAAARGNVPDLSDRSAVENDVYRQVLPNYRHAFTLPFVLPLEKLWTYLSHFKRTPADIAITLNRPPAEIAAAFLRFSPAELAMVTVADAAPALHAALYRYLFQVQANQIRPLNAQLLLRPMSVEREELGDIVRTRFVTANGAAAVIIQGEKTDNNSIQNDIQRIHGLTYDVLDRMHRFTRLWRHVNWHIAGLESPSWHYDWSVSELDYVLSVLSGAGLANGIDAGALTRLTELLQVQRRFQLPVDELCALWARVPEVAFKGQPLSLFTRLFNLPDFVLLDGDYPQNTVFVHPSFQPAGPIAAPVGNALFRLMAGVRISDENLYLLIRSLGGPQALNLQNGGFALTIDNLSLLYRHARLANMLDLSIPGLFQLMALNPGTAAGHIRGLDDLVSLLSFYDWWHSTGFSLDAVAYITRSRVEDPSKYPDADAVTAAIINEVTEEDALTFADTVFGYFEGMTEESSRAILAANAAVASHPAPGDPRLWLTDAYNPNAPLNIPGGVNLGAAAEADLRAILILYHASAVVSNYLARHLDFSVGKTSELIAMAGGDLSDPVFTRALQGVGPAGPLRDLIASLAPLTVLFQAEVFTAESLAFIRQNPGLFNNIDFAHLTVQDIRRLALYRDFLDVGDQADVRRLDLHSTLPDYTANARFSQNSEAALGRLFGVDPGLVRTIQNQVGLPNNPIDAVQKVKECAGLAQSMGVGGDALKLIISQNYDDLSRAADMVLSAFRAKYKDEKEWQNKIEPFQNRLLALRRDALTAYLTTEAHPEFGAPNDLYRHFLIDVDLSGCARVSRVVAGISSLQLYVHRCLMNLEQDADLAAANRIHVLPEQVPQNEWEWRQNYRVWEANRRVFLCPENYIEPALRDNKTPLFEELETELLQQEINEQTVLDAYAKYMREFEELAHLQIAGSYHHKSWASQTDVLHLFGVTTEDPPAYYYRTVENLFFAELPVADTTRETRPVHWSPWRKIDVQIPVRTVSPIVFRNRLYVFWVEIATTHRNTIVAGASDFAGYSHKMSVKYTTLRLDGTWTAPQRLRLSGQGRSVSSFVRQPFDGDGLIADSVGDRYDNSGNIVHDRPELDPDTPHPEPKDGYTLTGFLWDRVYPAIGYEDELYLMGSAFGMTASVDFYKNTIDGTPPNLVSPPNLPPFPALYKVVCSKVDAGQPTLYRGQQRRSEGFYLTPHFDGLDHIWAYDVVFHHAFNSIIVSGARIDQTVATMFVPYVPGVGLERNTFASGLYIEELASIQSDHDLSIINGSFEDCILDVAGDLLLLQGSVRPGAAYVLKRLGTTLSEAASRSLFTGGLSEFLSIRTQQSLREAALPLQLIGNSIEDKSNAGILDLTGPYGAYYTEIYFHIPFLIANHLNRQQKFREAQKWYHYIFNPTFSDKNDLQPGQTAEEINEIQRDWNWHYVDFRGRGVEALRQQLGNPQAIAAYQKDPFNPHAIARLRPNAYQKTVVMKYIDNLLDWGDQLFARDTTESINEATLLYTLAADILGDRPAALGDCGEGQLKRTYANIKPLLAEDSEFLIEMEHFVLAGGIARGGAAPGVRFAMEAAYLEAAGSSASRYAAGTGMPAPIFKGVEWKRNYTASWQTTSEGDGSQGVDTSLHTAAVVTTHGSWVPRDAAIAGDSGISLVSQISAVFCIPENSDLRRYWDRVEDRLFKIRHCLNISGDKRQLALFAPEIDPGLLVRAKAAGLSIQDVLNSISGDLPPYRFGYVVERAKSYANIVQSFGLALSNVLEKKDAEELVQLRTLQQRNVQRLTTQMREKDIKAADEVIATLERNKEAAIYRKNYYNGLATEGLIAWEHAQSAARHTAAILKSIEGVLHLSEGIAYLIPQVGSPFAMKYGGAELGDSFDGFAEWLRSTASVADAISGSAGLISDFQRRQQDWKHQFQLADHDLKQIERQLEAARIRKAIADRALEVHSREIEHSDEILEFYRDKFSEIGLYTFLSATLQRLYRAAYNSAYTMARLAEQAYHFERGDTSEVFIGSGYWDAARAGLLAGEQLQIDLQSMERRFVETNYRAIDITQSFSLMQINPAALLALKHQGECTFTIPEIFFDLFYPGHYKRILRSVRLTIPCITGPYTNVSATLSLVGSEIRTEPDLNANRVAVPPSRTAAISTSTAQNDGGVFEMNFRDERYMPFEGAGAISSWALALPRNFRQFDYETINDVVIHLSYTAERDAALRDEVERVNGINEGAILRFLRNNSLSRLISFRQEFSSEYHRLLHSAPGSPVKIVLMDKHFPMFMSGRNLKVDRAVLLLRPGGGYAGLGAFRCSIDGTAFNAFAVDANLGGLVAQPLGNVLDGRLLGEHAVVVDDAGALAPGAPAAGDPSALDPQKLSDVYLYLEYGVN